MHSRICFFSFVALLLAIDNPWKPPPYQALYYTSAHAGMHQNQANLSWGERESSLFAILFPRLDPFRRTLTFHSHAILVDEFAWTRHRARRDDGCSKTIERLHLEEVGNREARHTSERSGIENRRKCPVVIIETRGRGGSRKVNAIFLFRKCERAREVELTRGTTTRSSGARPSRDRPCGPTNSRVPTR